MEDKGSPQILPLAEFERQFITKIDTGEYTNRDWINWFSFRFDQAVQDTTRSRKAISDRFPKASPDTQELVNREISSLGGTVRLAAYYLIADERGPLDELWQSRIASLGAVEEIAAGKGGVIIDTGAEKKIYDIMPFIHLAPDEKNELMEKLKEFDTKMPKSEP